MARGCGPLEEDAERGPRPSAEGNGEQRRAPVDPGEPPSTPTSPPQPPIRAGSRLRVWRSFLLEKPWAEAEPPEAGEEQEKTLWSRLCADISAELCPRATLFPLSECWRFGAQKEGGSQTMLPGSESCGRQCQAHVPPAHYKCPGGGRSSRYITSLLGKGSGDLLRRLEPSPGAEVANGVRKKRRKVRRSLGSQLQPASATPPSQSRKETPGSCSLALGSLEVYSKLLLAP